uniref:Large ribosomal subunit protein mL44 n=1 Tax=Timema cristinae TaxID=61476 RepID=A0A7R9GQY6_TIMCR|nr:unnamed protein product [Timema cristinae]
MSALRSVRFVNSLKQLKSSSTLTFQRPIHRWVAPTLVELKRRKDRMGPQPLQHRATYLEWNYQAELYAFGKRLNEEFSENLLQCALTQRSYIFQEEARQRNLGIEAPRLALVDNVQLAGSGESLMSLSIFRSLRASLPLFPEEGISALHEYLMSNKVLAIVSSGIGTKDLILCSDFPVEEETLANTFKAVVGALAQSSGEERAIRFVQDFVVTHLCGKDVNEIWAPPDTLSTVSNILSREGKAPPEPRLIGEAGRNTILATYIVGIYSEKQLLGTGFGETLQTAKEMAAHNVLHRFFHTTETFQPVFFDENSDSGTYTKPNISLDLWTRQCDKKQTYLQSY